MSIKLLSAAQRALPVEPRATVLPVAIPGSSPPRPMRMPNGVRVRSKKCVEINFTYRGKSRFERLVHIAPTVAGVFEASQYRQLVVGLIATGRLVYSEMFPDSNLVRAAREIDRETVAEEINSSGITVGEALDGWLVSKWQSLAENTRQDYVKLIRGSLKTQDLTELQIDQQHFRPARHSGEQPRYAGFSTRTGPFKPEEGVLAETSTFPARRVWSDIALSSDEEPSVNRSRKVRDLRKAGDLAGARRLLHTKSVLSLVPLLLEGAKLALLEVKELTTDRLIHIRDLFLKAGDKRKTIEGRMGLLRQAMRRQFENGSIDRDPFDRLPKMGRSEFEAGSSDDVGGFDDEPVVYDPNEERDEGDVDPYFPDELEKVVDSLQPDMKNQIIFHSETGVRTGELIGLRVSDIDNASCRILVRRSISRGKEKSTKTVIERWVVLNPVAQQALKAQLEMNQTTEGWVFPNPFTGDRWADSSKIVTRLQKACERAGVRYRRPYQLRHTYASMMISAGENIMYVANQLGHADWEMVKRRYGRYIEEASGRADGEASREANAELHSRMLDRVVFRLESKRKAQSAAG